LRGDVQRLKNRIVLATGDGDWDGFPYGVGMLMELIEVQ
jgi:hypothetical protein